MYNISPFNMHAHCAHFVILKNKELSIIVNLQQMHSFNNSEEWNFTAGWSRREAQNVFCHWTSCRTRSCSILCMHNIIHVNYTIIADWILLVRSGILSNFECTAGWSKREVHNALCRWTSCRTWSCSILCMYNIHVSYTILIADWILLDGTVTRGGYVLEATKQIFV
jgi:hypothetical protein